MDQSLPRRGDNGGVGAVDAARGALERRSWRETYELLAAADSLEVEDLERLAITTVLRAASSGWRSRSCCAVRWPAPVAGGRAPSVSSRTPHRRAQRAASCSSPTSWRHSTA